MTDAKKIKVSEATGPALDWLVAKCEEPIGGYKAWVQVDLAKGIVPAGCNYTTNWAQGGPIIERERIATACDEDEDWYARPYLGDAYSIWFGPTPLIAAMRCYVASKLGEEIEVPDELN